MLTKGRILNSMNQKIKAVIIPVLFVLVVILSSIVVADGIYFRKNLTEEKNSLYATYNEEKTNAADDGDTKQKDSVEPQNVIVGIWENMNKEDSVNPQQLVFFANGLWLCEQMNYPESYQLNENTIVLTYDGESAAVEYKIDKNRLTISSSETGTAEYEYTESSVDYAALNSDSANTTSDIVGYWRNMNENDGDFPEIFVFCDDGVLLTKDSYLDLCEYKTDKGILKFTMDGSNIVAVHYEIIENKLVISADNLGSVSYERVKL